MNLSRADLLAMSMLEIEWLVEQVPAQRRAEALALRRAQKQKE